MAKKALAVDPNDGAAVTELADQMLMLGKYKDASDHYGRACQIDPENMPALHGMLQCHIIQKNYSDAEQQIELFKVLGTMDSAQVVFLDAMLAWRRNHQLSKQLELLESAYWMHFEEMDCAPVADVFDLKAAEPRVPHRRGARVHGAPRRRAAAAAPAAAPRRRRCRCSGGSRCSRRCSRSCPVPSRRAS